MLNPLPRFVFCVLALTCSITSYSNANSTSALTRLLKDISSDDYHPNMYQKISDFDYQLIKGLLKAGAKPDSSVYIKIKISDFANYGSFLFHDPKLEDPGIALLKVNPLFLAFEKRDPKFLKALLDMDVELPDDLLLIALKKSSQRHSDFDFNSLRDDHETDLAMIQILLKDHQVIMTQEIVSFTLNNKFGFDKYALVEEYATRSTASHHANRRFIEMNFFTVIEALLSQFEHDQSNEKIKTLIENLDFIGKNFFTGATKEKYNRLNLSAILK